MVEYKLKFLLLLLSSFLLRGLNKVLFNENVLSIGHDAYTKIVHNNVTGEDEEVEVSALTRKITHVTAGTNATDAVNVSQLTNAITAARTRYFGVNANSEEYYKYNI